MARISRAAANAIKFTRSFVPLPLHVEIRETGPYIASHSLNKPSKYLVLFVNCNLYFQFGFWCLQLLWYIAHWTSYTKHHLSDAIVCYVIACVNTVYLNASISFENNCEALRFVLNQSMTVLVTHSGRISRFKSLIVELIVYGLSSVALLASLAYTTVPFFLTSEPFQAVFGNSIATKLRASVLYTLTGLFQCGLACLILLICVVAITAFVAGTMGINEDMTNGRVNRSRFLSGYKAIQTARLIFAPFIEGSYKYMAVLTFVGVLEASGLGYGILKMFTSLPILVCLAAVQVEISIFAVALSVTYLAGVPRNVVLKFVYEWKKVPNGPEVKRVLTGIPNVGFWLGPYGIITALQGPTICNEIVVNTVSLVLLNA